MADGGYPDLSVGDECQFAVELTPAEFALVDRADSHLELVDGCDYRFSGGAVFATPRAVVLGVGILCFVAPPTSKRICVGQSVRGTGRLSVDPLYWQGNDSRAKGAPGLVYRWAIDGIGLNTTTFAVDPEPQSSTTRPPSVIPSKASLLPVFKTDAMRERGGYVLNCRLLGDL